MTSLEDKAAESPEVDLARQSAPGAYVLESLDLVDADDLTPEGEFPQFGDFLEVTGTAGEQYIECPQDLARQLVEDLDADVGTAFRILDVTKIDGSWSYEIEGLDDEAAEELQQSRE